MASIWRRVLFLVRTLVVVLTPPVYSFRRLEAHCRRQLERDPEDHFARWVLAELYKDNSRYDKAKAEFQVLVEQGYKTPSVIKALGEVCYNLQDYSGAAYHFEQVESHYSRQKLFNYHLGMSHLYGQTFEKALPYLIRAEELSLKKGPIYEAVGFCFFQLGNFEKSAEWYQKALSFSPSSPVEVRNNAARAHIHLANELLQAGKRAEACVQFRAALALRPEDSVVQAVVRTLTELGEEP